MSFENFLRETVEFQNRNGINPLTIGLAVAFIVFLVQTWGIISQDKKIRRNETREALPIYFFICQFFYFGSYVVYGLDIHSAAIIISNLPGFFMIFIVISLIKNKVGNIAREIEVRKKKIMCKRLKTDLIFSSLLSIILLSSLLTIKNRDSLVIAFLITIIIAMIPFAINVIKRKTFSIIGVKYLMAFAISSIAWVAYGVLVSTGWGIKTTGLIISSLITFLITAILIILRVRFDRKNP